MSDKKNTNNSIDPITSLIYESDALTQFDQIEKLVENKFDLSVLPVQPVYLALKALPVEKVAELLPRFSKEQREVFLDIDLWNKDEIDIKSFPFWLMAYHLLENDEVKKDFITSEQFLLFIKSKFNVWTFDAEDPNYPDHDNYFLTDDMLLLFEFEENFPFVNEVKELVKQVYYELGVENAYTFLFKMVSDSFLILQESEYKLRCERLRDFGFVNYMDALEIENPFIGIDFVNKFIKEKKALKVELDQNSKNQNIHNSALVAFKDHFKTVIDELLLVEDQKRLDYLQFNFVRLINARLESTDALKKGSVAMSRSGAYTKNIIQLGFSYLKSQVGIELRGNSATKSIFENFDFTELYKIGNSLLIFNKKKLKKALTLHGFDQESKESFLGEHWTEFLDLSFEVPIKFQKTNEKKAVPILDFETYEIWSYKIRTLIELLPFVDKFYETFSHLKEEGRLQDEFYLNYTVESINFETLLITSFANFFLGTYDEKNTSKLGLTLDEFKSFAAKIVTTEGKFVLTSEIYKKIQLFIQNFGLDAVFDINDYIQKLITNSMEGYDFSELSDVEYQHVGGPIILSIIKH
jgi:hypothetical protein